MEQDPRIAPETANVFHHDTNQTYGKRTFRAFIGMALAIFVMGGFVTWYFFGGQALEIESEDADTALPPKLSQTQSPGNEYEEGSGRSATYDFFYSVFGGIEDGLEDSPHNLKNVDHIDQFNIDADTVDPDVSPTLALKQYAEQKAAQLNGSETDDTTYRHSAHDAIGSNVIGKDGEKSGHVFDILVHKETGIGKAIIVQEDESRYGRDLTAINFRKVRKTQNDGDTFLTIAEDTLEQKPEFDYGDNQPEDYISLRRLRDGQVLDMDGKLVGQIDAVIYQNAKAQSIYFKLRPLLAAQGPDDFKIPFKELKVVENPDGLDVQLSAKQTKAMAQQVLN